MDCSVDGCVRKIFSKGLCAHHYEKDRIANAPPCSVDGCEKKSERRGMCNQHYRQQRLVEADDCSVDGCGRPSFAGGYCQTHYKRIQRYGSLDADKRAHDRGLRFKHELYQSWNWHRRHQNLCKEWHDDFWAMVSAVGERPSLRHVLRRLDFSKPIGPGNWHWMETRECADAAEYQREYRRRHPDRVRNTELKKRFGITLNDFNRMLEGQGGVCAICKQPETAKSKDGTARHLAVDHCHKTGAVRALLCTCCNMAIGQLERRGVLAACAEYLRKHKKDI